MSNKKQKALAEEDQVDIHVGARTREIRTFKGVTQDDLARALGISFQQEQKMEKGINRIGAGRLYMLARYLETPITEFYARYKGSKAAPAFAGDDDNDRSTLEFAKKFRRLDERQRQLVQHLINWLLR